jgi:Fe-S cluster assembly protein SufD
MSIAPSPKDHFLAEFHANESVFPGPRLAHLRRNALARFADLGFPTMRDEDWKYTRTTAIEKPTFRLAPAGANGLDTAWLQGHTFALATHLLVFVNGHFAPALSRLETLPSGVTISNLRDVANAHPERVETSLTRSAQSHNPFAALNAAFATDGIYLHLARGIKLAEPLHLLFVATDADAPIMMHVRNVIAADDDSAATIIESYAGRGNGTYFTNAVTDIVAGVRAAIDHYKLQEEGAAAFHVAGIHVEQNADSRFSSNSVSLGATLMRNDLGSVLAAPGAECVLNGLYLASGRQHMDNHTLIDHAAPQGRSREFYKGILDGRARAVFNGRVIVRPHAQKTDAQQTNRNLLLSEDAEIDTKPQLEIYADDVKCAHGATVGQLDKDALYYLRSRGIDQATARGVLTYAFASEVITRMKLAAVRARLEDVLVSRLPNSERVQEFL